MKRAVMLFGFTVVTACHGGGKPASGDLAAPGGDGGSGDDGMMSGTPTSLYASPTGGGSTCSRDLPCTLDGAQQRARAIAAAQAGDIFVNLLDGTYALTQTWELVPALDSGNHGFSIVYQADGFGGAQAAKPIVSGGRAVTGWTLADGAKNIWKASAGDLETRQLYVDGKRATRARQPSGIPGTVAQTATGYTTNSAVPQSWTPAGDVELVYHDGDGQGNWLWAEPRCPVASIAASAGGTTLTMAEPCFSLTVGMRGGHLSLPTAIENNAAFLDKPGEFYLDRTTPNMHTLFYIPRPGEDLAKAVVVAPVLELLVNGKGTLDSPLHDLQFKGITFSYATWLAPNSAHGFPESSYNKIGNASGPETQELGNVTLYAAHRVRFEGDTFEHLGGAGLTLDDGSQNNVVVGSVFADISGNGLQIGNVDLAAAAGAALVTDNTVSDSYFHDVGVEYPGAYGIWNADTQKTTVTHCYFAHLPRGGIASNYVYSNPPGVASGHQFTYNLVEDYLNAVRDGGGFDTNGTQNGVDGVHPNSLLRGNVFRDDHNNYGQIYLDIWSAGFTLENNVAYSSASLDYNTITGIASQPCCNTHRFNFYDQDNAFKYLVGDMVLANQVVAVSAMPASILANAGLEPAYRSLAPPAPAPADTQAPSAPGTPAAGAIGGGPSVTLSWAPATDNVGVTGYEVDGGDTVYAAVDGSKTSATVQGLAPGASYAFVVRARDAAGNLSAASAAVKVAVSGAADLVGRWSFDEGAGASAGDSSGSNNHGAITGAAWTAGKHGGALSFNGTSDYVSVGNQSILNQDRHSFTLAVWMSTTATGWRRMVTKGNWADSAGYLLQYNSGGVSFGVGSNANKANSAIANTPSGFGDGKWHHVAAVVDRAAATIQIYVDGVAQPLSASAGFCGSASGTALSLTGCAFPAASSNDPFTIGSYNGVAEYFAGALDELRVYNRALGAAEIGQLAQ